MNPGSPTPRLIRPPSRLRSPQLDVLIVLVANLGSTSLKYRLMDMSDERTLARGSVETIGGPESRIRMGVGDRSFESVRYVTDHADALAACLDDLTVGPHAVLDGDRGVDAVGFKAVHGGRLSGSRRVDDDVLNAMAEMNDVAPAHNPMYIEAMRSVGRRFENLPMVAAFETGYHATIPPSRTTYAIPKSWRDRGVRRYGFHGASHRYIATRMAQRMGRDDARIISCHLGGSSSITASVGTRSVFTTMGMTPQTGLPQNNRVGDFDPFALLLIAHSADQASRSAAPSDPPTLESMLQTLASEGGLAGISGRSNDIREIHTGAAQGDADCQLAVDVFVEEIRRQIGGALMAAGGADAIVMTGGIGENDVIVRRRVLADLRWCGIELDADKNAAPDVDGDGECPIHASGSDAEIWIVPTNEELIVARQTVEVLNQPSDAPEAG